MTTTTPENTARTWRDLADQLTAAEIDALERLEVSFGASDRAQDALLDDARSYIEHRLIDAALVDVPVPAGAETDSASWNRGDDGWSRAVVWRELDGDGPTAIGIDGRQHSDGRFNAEVALYCDTRTGLTSDQARRLAADLLEAADELDRIDTDLVQPPPS